MSPDDIDDDVSHRRNLETMAIENMIAYVVHEPAKAQSVGEACRTAIDALLGKKASNE